MKHAVTCVRDLKVVLKDLESCIKAPDFLRKGREFGNFALRPREALANWLLCAVLNFENTVDKFSFSTDPIGGDGIIVKNWREGVMRTEHVFIPTPRGATTASVEEMILKAICLKNTKGSAYADGKDLIVFSEAVGKWFPNRVARKIKGISEFGSVWVMHLERAMESSYTYCIAKLEISMGNSPAWKVFISIDFDSWRVERLQ